MISITSQSGKAATYVTEFMADSVEDIIDLPKFPAVAPGSSCICLENSAVYMLGNDNIWHEL